MYPALVNSPGVFFRITDPWTSQIVSWRRDVDEAVIRRQLERSSQVLVLGLHQHGMTYISEMPERGKYVPYFGMTGGGFEFAFHPTGEMIELAVYAVPGVQSMVYPNSVEPLKIAFSGSVVHVAEVHDGVGITGIDDMILYLPEFLFGFYGQFFDMFRAWKWYSEDYEQFEFIFVPTSISVVAHIKHLESNEVLDMTRNVDW